MAAAMPYTSYTTLSFNSRVRGRCCEAGRRHVLARAKGSQQKEEKDAALTLNPVELGRRSRQAIDDAWYQVTRLSTPRASFTIDDDLGAGLAGELQTPQAEFTRVLVVGGTGRVGRIVVRKLLLRGYQVRVMCRDLENKAVSMLPSGADIVQGDVGNLQDCVRACRGIDKIIYCATAQIQMSADIEKVDSIGVSHISRAWIDGKHSSAAKAKTSTNATKRTVAHFKKEADQEAWDLTHVGPTEKEVGYQGQDYANALITEDRKRLCFQGSIFSRSGICEWGGPCGDLTDCEAIQVRLLADGKPYLAVLEDEDGNSYTQVLNSGLGFTTAWLPFNRFRAESPSAPPMRPGMIKTLKFRFDKSLIPAEVALSASVEEERQARNGFTMELAYIKAQRVRTEPTMVLVSCAAAAGQDAAVNGTSAAADAGRGAFAGPEATVLGNRQGVNARRVSLKRAGEAALRASGLGYCIVRPSALFQEPGGYKALVFDQGDRIQEGIGYADVADVCLRALHAPEAVNKTFEVCYETLSDGNIGYELVAHMPDKANNFLKQALSDFERNT